MIKLVDDSKVKPHHKSLIGFTLTAFLIYLAIIYADPNAQKQIVFEDTPFQYHVYCPISSKAYLKQYLAMIKNSRPQHLRD